MAGVLCIVVVCSFEGLQYTDLVTVKTSTKLMVNIKLYTDLIKISEPWQGATSLGIP